MSWQVLRREAWLLGAGRVHLGRGVPVTGIQVCLEGQCSQQNWRGEEEEQNVFGKNMGFHLAAALGVW